MHARLEVGSILSLFSFCYIHLCWLCSKTVSSFVARTMFTLVSSKTARSYYTVHDIECLHNEACYKLHEVQPCFNAGGIKPESTSDIDLKVPWRALQLLFLLY